MLLKHPIELPAASLRKHADDIANHYMQELGQKQIASLHAHGLVVRNTFIDGPTPVPRHAAPRARSAPSEFCRRPLDSARCPTKCGDTPLDTPRSVSTACPTDSCSPADSSCSSSTAWQYEADCQCLSSNISSSRRPSLSSCPSLDNSDGEILPKGLPYGIGSREESARQILELVQHECAFLRIRGHGLRIEKHRQRSVAATLCIFVQGLPWSKRAKWLLPLLWSVSAVLQRCGCAARVRGGVLRAPLDDVDGGETLRIDFAAARE